MSKEKEEKQEKPYWEGKEYSFYNHKKCEFFLAMKLQIRKILTACFVIALYMLWVVNVEATLNTQSRE